MILYMNDITPEEAQKIIKNENVVVIDVRTPRRVSQSKRREMLRQILTQSMNLKRN